MGFVEEGRDVVIPCPTEFVTPDTWDLIRAAELAEKGHWPVSGGWLDQVAGVVDAVRYVWRVESEIQSKS